MNIIQIQAKDAHKLSRLIQQVENESAYMLYEPGERKLSTGSTSQRIEALSEQQNSVILAAEQNNQLVGYLMAIGGKANRTKHSAYLVAGILSAYRGQGVGTALFKELEQWAVHKKVHRLELTVVTKNIAAISLYEKVGYNIEGIKKNSLFIEGEFVDEYYMAKLL